MLRNRGIDPFHRSSLSKIVANAGTSAADAQIGESEPPRGTGNQLALLREPRLPGATRPLGQITPAQIPADRDALPSREALTEQRRAAEILRIQRDIARRRRIKQFWLAVRLLLLVGIPTAIAGWYYYVVATPLYETRSQFLIQQADTASVGSGNSILSGIQLNPDSVAVQSYLTSKNAMLRLDDEIGFKSAFQDPALDPLLRLPPDATDDDAFKTYSDMLKVGYDPTEGVLDMDVIAPDPALSEEYSRALIRYAEGMVDDMTSRVRSDQMAGAQENYEEAERRVRDAQAEVQALQEQMGVLDPQSESGLVMSRIGQLQGELTSKQLELAQLQANAQPNPSRVQGVEGDIARLRELIAETRSELTEGSDAGLRPGHRAAHAEADRTGRRCSPRRRNSLRLRASRRINRSASLPVRGPGRPAKCHLSEGLFEYGRGIPDLSRYLSDAVTDSLHSAGTGIDMTRVTIGNFDCGNDLPLTIIAGPCQLETLDHALMIGETMAKACEDAGANYIFKASYDKANRTSLKGRRGVGMDEGLRMLEDLRDRLGCPVLTDVHDIEQARAAGAVADVIQIPAFLSRQTDPLIAAGETGAVVNIKKGQFLAPWDMPNVRQGRLDREQQDPPDRARGKLRL